MKRLLSFLLLLSTVGLWAQPCDTSQVTSSAITLLSVDSENGNHPAIDMLDGDPNTYFQTNGSDPFPHEIVLDLGESKNINQLTIRPRQDQTQGRLKDYVIYISDDPQAWGDMQARSQVLYEFNTDRDQKVMGFGAVSGRYLRIVGLSTNDAARPYRWTISELEIWADSCATISHINQTLDFNLPDKAKSIREPIPLTASATSGLSVNFEVVSGPAVIDGGKLSFTGEGKVRVRAFQEGDGTYYPVSTQREIQVLDPSNYPPVVDVSVHELYPVEMFTLKPYPVYAYVELADEELFEIDTVVFEISGKRYIAEKEGNAYRINWQPEKYGLKRFYTKAITKDGVATVDSQLIVVATPLLDRTSRAFYGDVIQFGGENSRWLTKSFELPTHVGVYDSLHARFWTECPNVNGGCDDWDRLAWIEVQKPSGEWVEIIRYITPYGKGCNSSIDLTDYLGVLHGKVKFRMFIDTWGTGGWDVNLELDYFKGAPDHDYSQVDVLWKGAYSFGNLANLQPVEIKDYTFREDGSAPRLHLVTTGHGWGQNNTSNAAEFLHNIHHVYVDQTPTFVQDLWADCNPNPDGCQPQFGTWEFDRAGWCPGAIANRYIYDLETYRPQGTINLMYRFDSSYVDYCHVNNPNCISGVTCNNCNDGYNPFYQVSANIITYYDSITPTAPEVRTQTEAVVGTQFDFEIVPNPATQSIELVVAGTNALLSWSLMDLSGRVIMGNESMTSQALNGKVLDISSLPAGLYMVRMVSGNEVMTKRLIKE
ncbi:MAG: discoidin domain-containing protein [Bacteroidota bacterium]